MSIVVRDSGDIYFDGTNNVSVMSIFVDSAADLSGLVQYEDIHFLLGSDALDVSTGNKYRMKSDGTWVLQPDNMWQNVYTKNEVDNIVTRIDSDITDVENDVSDLHLALSDVINSGGKNKMPVASGQSTPPTRWINIPVVLAAGTYRVFFGDLQSDDTDSNLCQACFLDSSNTQVSNWLTFTRGTDVSAQANITGETAILRLYPSDSYAHSQNDTVTFDRAMICDKVLWDISNEYVPYCPTLYELYQLVKSYHP
jgi:hypothetical protein